MDIQVIMKKGKNATAAYVHSECSRQSATPTTLFALMDFFLDPLKSINDFDSIEWCKRLMSGIYTPVEFAETVRKFDTGTTCGLVWTANFVAYRCRTCGISPCMSLCADCFQRGNHEGHDFNMFKSQAGGACDCGDTNVMKECGFCYVHGARRVGADEVAPEDLLIVANAMMPKILQRLLLHMREHCNSLHGFLGGLEQAEGFIQWLHDMSCMGTGMRAVMARALTNSKIYTIMNEIDNTKSDEHCGYTAKARQSYESALLSLTTPDIPNEYSDVVSLQKNLVHRTFLDELVFWTAKFEFPQKIVCLLLNLLPDHEYKEHFTRAFVLHYSRISQLLVTAQNPDILSNRVVHVSVQLFSNERLATKMVEEMKLLHVMVISLKSMISKVLMVSNLHGTDTRHRVVDCLSKVMKDHCYWPIVSDLNNLLSHRAVALKFMEDEGLLKMWFGFLSMFQGMNVNHKELNQHIDFEPNTYYASFSAELEASATPMWALMTHLKDSSTAHLTRNLIRHCRAELLAWFDAIEFSVDDEPSDTNQASFHLPLHRYFSVLLQQGVKAQGIELHSILPSQRELLALIEHPLRVQSLYYEIASGLWARNGLQIKGQAMTYIQCHFCNSMLDADIYLLQIAMVNLDSGVFLNAVAEKFHILPSLTVQTSTTNPYFDSDQETMMMENYLIFLSTLTSVRTCLGTSDSDLVTKEMTTLLCISDKTHSNLMEYMPERIGSSAQSKEFEEVLGTIADFCAPHFDSNGSMQQGLFAPKPRVWDEIYDPIYVLLRTSNRRDFQTSLDRFSQHASKTKGSVLWPPYRSPPAVPSPYTDPRNILLTRVFHGMAFVILYKAVHLTTISDQTVSLVLFLLESALKIADVSEQLITPHEKAYPHHFDMNFATWFNSDCIYGNMCSEINHVVAIPSDEELLDEPTVSAMEVEPFDNEMSYSAIAAYPTDYLREITGQAQLALMGPQSSLISIEAQDESNDMQLVVAPSKPIINLARMEVEPRVEDNQIPCEVVIRESIISLLLKLHSKMTKKPDSYLPHWEALPETSASVSFRTTDENVGDGPHFVQKLLDNISVNRSCREKITATRAFLWRNDDTLPKQIQQKDSKSIAEERRKKLMADMTNKQHKFMTDNNMEDVEDEEETATIESEVVKPIEYDCVICNQTSPSFESNPIGLVILLQPSSVLGKQCKEGTADQRLPVCDSDVVTTDNLATICNARLQEYKSNFKERSWTMCVSSGWDGGVIVQTCGHHLHHRCLQTYLEALRGQQRQANISIESGEFSCPFCRQLGNSFLPLSSENTGRRPSEVSPSEASCSSLKSEYEVSKFLKECTGCAKNSPMVDAMKKAMADITDTTLEKYVKAGVDPTPQNMMLVINSVARINLELELLELGGDFTDRPRPTTSYQMPPKRSCFVPLFDVLGIHYKMIAQEQYSARLWEKLLGVATAQFKVSHLTVPLLLMDISTVLLHILLNLPLRMELAHFVSVIQAVFNLKYIQVLTTLNYRSDNPLHCRIMETLDPTLYAGTEPPTIAAPELEIKIKKHLLPYLRFVTLLLHHLYGRQLPLVKSDEQDEFICLSQFIGLSSEGMKWVSPTPMTVVQQWCAELNVFIRRNNVSARNLISTQCTLWKAPMLLSLPTAYEPLFKQYHQKKCELCGGTPKDPSVCLICGQLVCLKEICCKDDKNVFEATQHAMTCGAGTGVYLSVHSSTIVVFRGKRACLWGCVYLDCYGEEDRELKRGKPLKLCQDRFDVLQQQWVAHQFDHTNKKWIFHNNGL